MSIRRVWPARAARAAGGLPCSRRAGETGAAAVEFALVLPLLAMLLLGVVTVGLAYSNHLAITNAVREGARFGATAPNTGLTDSVWAAAVVQDTVDSYADTNNPLDPTHVCALLIEKSGGATPTYTPELWSDPNCKAGSTPAGAVPGNPSSIPDGCFIKVWAEQPAKLNWIFVSTTVTLRADSVAIYDRSQLCP